MEVDQKSAVDVKIKLLKPTDYHRFARLRNNINWESKKLVAKGGERKETGLHIFARKLLSSRALNTLVAFDGREMVGYINIVFAKFSKLRGNAYITISVSSTHQGLGIGKRLMLEAENFCRENQIRRIELEVFGRNIKAIGLYKKLGYEIEGVKKKAVFDEGEFDDMIIMAKFI